MQELHDFWLNNNCPGYKKTWKLIGEHKNCYGVQKIDDVRGLVRQWKAEYSCEDDDVLEPTEPSILYYDIETTSFHADFGEVLMFAYKFHGEEKTNLVSVLDYPKSFELPIEKRDYYVVKELVSLLNQADYTVAHYGSKFDSKFVQTRAVIHEHPIADIRWANQFDTCITARKNLKLQSNRLANVAEALGVQDNKLTVPKYIWRRANAYDKEAIKNLHDYCIRDVDVLVKIAEKLRPFAKHLPSMQIITRSEDTCCYACGRKSLQRFGYYATKATLYKRYKCSNCGAFQRSAKKVFRPKERKMY